MHIYSPLTFLAITSNISFNQIFLSPQMSDELLIFLTVIMNNLIHIISKLCEITFMNHFFTSFMLVNNHLRYIHNEHNKNHNKCCEQYPSHHFLLSPSKIYNKISSVNLYCCKTNNQCQHKYCDANTCYYNRRYCQTSLSCLQPIHSKIEF